MQGRVARFVPAIGINLGLEKVVGHRKLTFARGVVQWRPSTVILGVQQIGTVAADVSEALNLFGLFVSGRGQFNVGRKASTE